MLFDKYHKTKTLSGLFPDFNTEGIKSKTFWSRIAVMEEQFNESVHNHSFFELHFCLSGNATLEIAGESISLNAEDFVLINKHEDHKTIYQSEDFVKFVWGFIVECEDKGKTDYLNRTLNFSKGKYKSTPIMNNALENLLCGVERLRENRAYVVCASLAELFFEMCAIIAEESSESLVVNAEFKDKNERLVEKIKTYVRDNIYESPNAGNIAAEFSLSERQIRRIFEKHTEKTLSEFLKEEIFLAAQKLMVEEKMSLQEIAMTLGYADVFTFSKAFKRHVGISPGAFRKDTRKK